MKNIHSIIKSFVLFGLIIQFLNINAQNPGFFIINGEEIDISDAPWQVSLEINEQHHCGGVILNENWILTAAHCIKEKNGTCHENIVVHAGATNQTLNNLGQRIAADLFITEAWQGLTDLNIPGSWDNHDLALIHLSSPLYFNDDVQPIGFTSSNIILPYGNNGELTGWGNTENGTLSEILRRTEIQLISVQEHNSIASFSCGLNIPIQGLPNENNIVFHSNLSSSGKGDSGGPAIMDINGSQLLVGICSRLGSCAQELPGGGTINHLFSIYTKVQNYESFILDHIGDEIISHCEYKHTLPKNIRNTYIVKCPMSITHDVTVKSGATLTIRDDVYFGENVTLTIENGATLVIDGGKLTSCNAQNSWRGIKIKGQNWASSIVPGKVVMKNNAVIENAIVGIDNTNKIVLFPGMNIEYGGGILELKNSSIRDCQTAIKMAPFGNPVSPDQSIIDNMDVYDNIKGLVLNGNKGIKIYNSDFYDNLEHDIDATSSTVEAINNTFHSAIEFYATHPMTFGSVFQQNNILNAGIRVEALANMEQSRIRDNSFFDAGYVMLGEQDYLIQLNDFYGSGTGCGMFWTRDNIQNLVQSNAYYNTDYGNSAWGINDAEFLKNCFENTGESDIEVNENSSIHERHGEQDDGAGNCFHPTARIETSQTSAFFDYFLLNSVVQPQDCKQPGVGNFNVEDSTEDEIFPCGSGENYTGELPARYRDCHCYNRSDCINMISGLRAQIASLESNSLIDPWVKKWLLARYRRCLDRAIKKYGLLRYDEGGKEAAIETLKSQVEFRYKASAYGIMVDSLETVRARAFLDSLNATTNAELDFVTAQHIYLDYLEDIENYTLSYADSLTLRTIGSAKNPLAGFARSIYRVITGQKIEVYLTHLNNQGEFRSQKSQEDNVIHIFPNPMSDEGFSVYIKDINEHEKYEINVFDQLGLNVYSGVLTKNITQIPGFLKSGVYFVDIAINGLSVSKQKLIKP